MRCSSDCKTVYEADDCGNLGCKNAKCAAGATWIPSFPMKTGSVIGMLVESKGKLWELNQSYTRGMTWLFLCFDRHVILGGV